VSLTNVTSCNAVHGVAGRIHLDKGIVGNPHMALGRPLSSLLDGLTPHSLEVNRHLCKMHAEPLDYSINDCAFQPLGTMAERPVRPH
jgi:hypothetical protein